MNTVLGIEYWDLVLARESTLCCWPLPFEELAGPHIISYLTCSGEVYISSNEIYYLTKEVCQGKVKPVVD